VAAILENTAAPELDVVGDVAEVAQPVAQQPATGRANMLIGNTPLIDLSALAKTSGVRILAKAEFMNPSGSIKDRIALHILSKAEREGRLRPGDTVVASTSGNTGSAIAMVCALRGYKYIVITNAKCSEEKRESMRAYGGEVIVAEENLPADHPEHYVNLEATLCERNTRYFGVDQYENADNPDAYYNTLGPEIWEQTSGEVTHFVAGGSTGGTMSGTSRFLKEASEGRVQTLMPDPVGSVLWGAYHGDGTPAEEGALAAMKYKVEGVGKDSVPGALSFENVDAMLSVTDKEAFDMCRRLSETEGVLAGGSGGLNVHAAVELSERLDKGTIVTVLPDSGVKYLSKIFNSSWRDQNGLKDGAEDPQENLQKARIDAGPEDALAAVADHPQKPPLANREEAGRFLQAAVTMFSEYATARELHQGGPAGAKAIADQPVIKLRSPEQICGEFARVGVPMAIGDNEEAAGREELLEACQLTLDLSMQTNHPLFMNQLYAGPDPVGLVGEWLVAAANSNVHTYEVAPVFTLAEREALAKMARMWMAVPEGGETPTHDGLFVPGGSMANMYGILLARHAADPEVRERGLAGGPRMVGFCSDEAHYSFLKGAATTGLGRQNMVAVATDDDGVMIPEALDAAIEEAKAAGAKPFFVGATAGTTVLGAYDNFTAVRKVCDRHGVWMHVDAAWGSGAFLSPRLRAQYLAGVESADSITWNPHKQMNMPLTCSAFLTKKEGALREANASSAAYLFQPDKLYTEMDLGDRSIQCGRRADAFKLWLAWKSKGDKQWAAESEHAYDLAATFERRIRASERRFVMAARRSCTNVCFWYVPPRLRPQLALHALLDGDEMDPEGPVDISGVPKPLLDELQGVAPKLKARMQETGDAMIGFQQNKGLPNFFRCVFAGAKGLDETVLEELLERMDVLGQDL